MAYLNKEERDALLDEIKNMKYNKIKGKLMRMDKKSRLAYFRNVQEVGRWMTRIVLEGLGTQVTLVETLDVDPLKGAKNRDYTLVEIIVEPTNENRL